MTETDYAPVIDAPDIAPAREEHEKRGHPEYGSCPNCIKAVRVDKHGRLRDHNTPELAAGSIKATFRCPGSGKVYAEHGDFGQTWDLRNGRWEDLAVEVFVLLVAHDQAGDVELPRWQVAEIPATELSRAVAPKLADASKWRIELVFADRNVTGHLVRLDTGDSGPLLWETRTDRQLFNGTMSVITELAAILQAADATDDAQAAARG